MGYPSYVSGSAKGKNLVQQLLDQGLQQDGEEIDAPAGCFTGGVMVDDDTVAGSEAWLSSYGFGALVQALHQVQDLEFVDLHREGEDQGDVEGYRYENGTWYALITVQHLAREDQARETEEAIASVVAPCEPPNAVADAEKEERDAQQHD